MNQKKCFWKEIPTSFTSSDCIGDLCPFFLHLKRQINCERWVSIFQTACEDVANAERLARRPADASSHRLWPLTQRPEQVYLKMHVLTASSWENESNDTEMFCIVLAFQPRVLRGSSHLCLDGGWRELICDFTSCCRPVCPVQSEVAALALCF